MSNATSCIACQWPVIAQATPPAGAAAAKVIAVKVIQHKPA